MGPMDALSDRVRRPEPPIAAGISLVVTGLVAAIVLGNTLAAPPDSSPRPGGGPTSQPGSSGPSPTAGVTSTPRFTEITAPTLGTVRDSLGWKPVEWSPDGSTLLVRHADADFGVLRADGRIEPIEAEAATWWPGGARTLSVVVRELDAQASLQLRPLDGGELRTLVSEPEIAAVAWTPDGESVAVAGSTGVLLGTSSGAFSPLTTTDASRVTISPDGTEVAYVAADGARAGAMTLVDVRRREAATAQSIRMSDSDVLAWSPNGRFLAFTNTEPANARLYLLAPTLPQSPTMVLSDVDPATVRWSVDGLFLAASRTVEPDGEVTSIRVRPGSARLERLGPGHIAVWSPTGDAIVTVDSTGRLFAYPVAAGDEPETSDSTPASPQTPRVYASDADPSCTPAWSPADVIAYCNRSGELKLVKS
jgi:WD40 repeat protein